jgi:uncharacterized membrane protein
MGAILLGEFGAIGLDLVAAIPLHHTIKPTAAWAAPLSVSRRTITPSLPGPRA